MNSKDWKNERSIAYDMLAIAVQLGQRVRVDHALKRINRADRMIAQLADRVVKAYPYQTKHKRTTRKG